MNLDSPISKLPLVGPFYVKKLDKLGIKTIEDLLLHVPSRYLDFRRRSDISKIQPGETVTVKGEITFFKNQYTRTGRKMQIGKIADNTGEITIVWFNQPFLIRTMKKGSKVILAGKVDWFGRQRALISPSYEFPHNGKLPVHTGRLVPIYPETSRVSSKWLRGRISYAYDRMEDEIEEFLPQSILKKYHLKGIKRAISGIHFPEDKKEVEEAVKRLSFDEFLFLQLRSLYRKKFWKKNRAVYTLSIKKDLYDKFVDTLPFRLTKSQERSIQEIFSDLKGEVPMNRLLEGDVGSGKTVVAAAAAFASFTNGHQSIFMVPTQILSQQHFDTLQNIFDPFKIRVKQITSAGIEGDEGSTDIYVGTHSLIHKKVDFRQVALVVIDEQHRFGVEQRAHLIKKSGNRKIVPHILTMTATPIPRTVALTIYGDLTLSTLDELPKGRKPITTWIVPPSKRKGAYRWIGQQIEKDGVQAYLICPLIEESETEIMSEVKAATVEYEKLKKIYPKLKLGLLHGRLKSKKKNEILSKFKKGKLDILVSTPVVEVGIDVPNASIMMIEGSERFGLAQLHQLRGRIGRGEKKSYCLLFTESRSPKVNERLTALKSTLSGFKLAELDLKMRGPGEVFGLAQHGFPELKIASWQDEKLLKESRELAEEAIEKPRRYKKIFKKAKSEDIVPN